MRCLPAILAASALIGALAGCGEESGVESGATVSVYVDSGLCAGARAELSRQRGEAGDLRVQMLCLDPVPAAADSELATIGANARRATEDSTAVAFIEPPDSTTAKFSHPILESANLGWTTSSSGSTAMQRVLSAIESADSDSVRDEVREALEPS